MPRDIDNPYGKDDICDALKRKYQVAVFDWVAGTDLRETVVFPDALLAVPNINCKLSRFAFLKANVQYEVRVNSTPFHVGVLGISHLPGGSGVSHIDLAPEQRLCNEGIVLSVSSSNAASGHLPMIYNGYIDVSQLSTSYTGRIGRLYIDSLTDLSVVGGATTPKVSISVFASFEDPDVAGFYWGDEVTVDTAATPQDLEAITKAAKGVAVGIGTEVKKTLTSAVGDFAFGKPLKAIEDFLSSPFALFGLAKPRTDAAISPTIPGFLRDVPGGRGTDMAHSLSLDPRATLLPLPNKGFDSLKEYIMIPALIHTYAFTPDSAANEVLETIYVDPSTAIKYVANGATTRGAIFQTPLGSMTRMFSFWRGGMKYRFMFCTSKFVTARFRISWIPSMWNDIPDPVDVESVAGDVASIIVDVRGDTTVDFVVPYMAQTEFLNCKCNPSINDDSFCNNGTLKISLVNKVVTPDPSVDVTVHCLVFQAAAEDFQFSSFIGPGLPDYAGFEACRSGIPVPPAPPVFDDEDPTEDTALRGEFQKPFKPFIPAKMQPRIGSSSSEEYNSFSSLIKRYAFLAAGDTIILPDLQFRQVGKDGTAASIMTDQSLLHYIARHFLAYRGSMNVKTQKNIRRTTFYDTASPMNTYDNPVAYGDPALLLSVTGREIPALAEVSFPYQDMVPFYLSNYHVGEYDLWWGGMGFSVVGPPSDLPTSYFLAAGDDFQFFYPHAPPMLVLWTQNPPAPLARRIEQSALPPQKKQQLREFLLEQERIKRSVPPPARGKKEDKKEKKEISTPQI